ncbi:MAG: 2'-5' RNA ligase family protein [Planctomycetes bacterium]|nr:2'-5' RNA ligase family protein [Planctomycetota bacterium]
MSPSRAAARNRGPAHQSAAVLIPPPELWQRIQEIRCAHDRAFGRWMPHVTLLHPFLPETFFDEAANLALLWSRRPGPSSLPASTPGRTGPGARVSSRRCAWRVAPKQAVRPPGGPPR